MEVVSRTYKQKYCPYRKAWVNQGLASCNKGKNPWTDCKDCEFMEEQEVTESYTSTGNNSVMYYDKETNEIKKI